MFNKKLLIYIPLSLSNLLVNAHDSDSIYHNQILQEVVINSRLNSPIQHSGTLISTINKKEILFQQPQTSADLLGLSGNIFIQKSQMAGGSPMIRGLATNRLLYTVDGVRMNTAIFRAGNLQNVISLDPFTTQNVEIIFGPQSVLYGSDALGGVMNFNTLKPTLSPNNKLLVHGNSTLRYASANNEKTGHFDIQLGWKRWALMTSFSNFNFGNLRIGSHGPNEYLKPFIVEQGYRSTDDKMLVNPNDQILAPTEYQQTNIMQKVLYAPNNYTHLTYAFHKSETSTYPRYDRLFVVNSKNNKPNFAENLYGPQKWMMNLLTIENNKSNIFYNQLTLRLAHQKFEESRIERKFQKKDKKTQIEKVNAYSINLDLKKNFAPNINLFYGAEYVYNHVNSTAYIKNIENQSIHSTSPRYPKSKWQSAAAYLSTDYSITPSLHLLAGLRYNFNHIKMNFSQKKSDIDFPILQKVQTQSLTGNIALDYAFTHLWSGRVSYSRGFRTPNVDDYGKTFKKDSKSIVLPNTNIHPEYASNFELGTTGNIGNKLQLDLSLYYTLLNDVIVTDDYSLKGKNTFDDLKIVAKQNGKSAYLYGLNFAAKWNILNNLSCLTHLNYQMGKETLKDGSKNTMPHVAPFFGDIRLQYQVNKIKIQVYSIFQAEMSPSNMPIKLDENQDNYLINKSGKYYSPAWATLNIKAMYHLSKNIDLTMGIENLTDLRYRVYRSGVPAAGRNFICSFNYHL